MVQNVADKGAVISHYSKQRTCNILFLYLSSIKTCFYLHLSLFLTELWYKLVLPPGFDKSKKYPLLIDVYVI